jgi:cofilin
MSNTGITVSNECVTEFNEFKIRNKYRYMIFNIVGGKEVKIEKTGPLNATYDQFLADLPANDARYAVFKFDYTHADGQRQKLVLFLWVPETSPIKSKMIYAGTKDTIKKTLQGLQVEIQGTDKSEVDYNEVLAKCQSVSK